MKKWQNEDGTFKNLSDVEMKDFSDAEMIEYKEELIKETVKTEVNEIFKGLDLLAKEDMEILNKKIEEVTTSQEIAEMKTNIAALHEAAKGFKSPVANVSPEDIDSALEANKAMFQDVENWKNNKQITLKNVVKDNEVVKATVDTGDIASNNIARRIPGIGQLAYSKPVMTDFFTTYDISGESNRYYYTDWDANTAAQAATALAENAAFQEGTAAWTGADIKLEKIGAQMKVTDEMMRYYSTFMQEVRNFLIQDVETKINTDLYAANGTTPNVNGIYGKLAPVFDYSSYSGVTASDANLADLIAVLKTEIETGRDKKYNVSAVFVNPKQYLGLRLEKDANGRSLFREIEESLDVTVVPTNYVTDNTLVIGDMGFARLLSGTDYIIDLGYINDDFNKDLYTLKGKRYTNLLIREVDKTGFLKVASVSAAILAITTP